jgi:hypothetical protein
MEVALKGLEKTIAAGRLKDRNKMERRLGKVQARHPQANDLYDVALKDTAEGVRPFGQTLTTHSQLPGPPKGSDRTVSSLRHLE